MPVSPMSVSIVIPVYNGGESFKQCLASIKTSLRIPDEVIVVSDGDTDGSWQVAEAAGAKVLKLSTSGGPARARNVGAQATSGEIVFFVDADVTLYPDTVGLVEQAFQQQPDLAALIGSYDDAPGADNFLSQYKNLFHHYTHQTSSETASTFWGACGAIRRSAFQAVGGFDEGYRKPCIEDIELGYRLKRAGYSIRLCKDIWVKHLKRWEPISLLRAEIFYRALPWTELMLRDRRFDADLNLSNANRISVLLTFSLVGSLVLSVVMPNLLWIVAACAIALLAVNASVYWFFYKKRGLLFALRVIPWHWFYFLYGGGAFAYGTLKHYWNRLRLSESTAV
ncbi:MAG: glycosyltransferase [Leptolyngbyaceae cyanobacterium]